MSTILSCYYKVIHCIVLKLRQVDYVGFDARTAESSSCGGACIDATRLKVGTLFITITSHTRTKACKKYQKQPTFSFITLVGYGIYHTPI